MITQFKNQYNWLSNMHMCQIIDIDGIEYPSVENAFQANKCLFTLDKEQFININPYEAKRLGRTVPIIDSWDKMKIAVMYKLVLIKFTKNSDLMNKLISTGSEELIEGNTWGDTFWGYDFNKRYGHNHLGKILMKVRQSLLTKSYLLPPLINPYLEKDQAKLDLATKYVGYGYNGTSTENYRISLSPYGIVNADKYVKDDIVFFSVNGGNKSFNERSYIQHIKHIKNANAKIITDNLYHRSRRYNTGEQWLAEVLIEYGFKEYPDINFSIWSLD